MNSISTNLYGIKLSNVLSDLNYDINIHLKRLATGAKINCAKDDAANLVINTKLNSQISGLNVSNKNIQVAYSAINVASGALNSIKDKLEAIKLLNIQALNETYNDDEKNIIQNQINSLYSEVLKIQDSTTCNNKLLFVETEKIDPNKTYTSTQNQIQTKTANANNLSTTTIQNQNNTSNETDNVSLTGLAEETYTSTKGTVNFSNGEKKIVTLGGLRYQITNKSSADKNSFSFEIKNGVTYFNKNSNTKYPNYNNFEIKALDDADYNASIQIEYVTFYGSENGKNTISGNKAAITIYGGKQDDVLSVSGIRSFVYGRGGNDNLTIGSICSAYGEEGDDVINITSDNACAFGGEGDDTFTRSDKYSSVVIDGGEGNNEISDSYQFSEKDLISNIKGKTTLSDSIELKAYETINVKINGINYKIYNKNNGQASLVWQVDSDGKITFGGSSLNITGQENVAHNVVLKGTDMTFWGGEKDDTIENYAAYGNIYGCDGNDTLINHNSILSGVYGGNGDDTIISKKTTSKLSTGLGNNTIYFESTENTAYDSRYKKFEGNNTIYINSNRHNFTAANNVSFDKNSNNTFYINGSNNKIDSGSGHDSFIISGDNNTINCGDGNDYCLVLKGNHNNINGQGGNNNISDFGNDTISSNFNNKPSNNTSTILPNHTDTITIDGKTYTIANNTSTPNKIDYTYNTNTKEITFIGNNFAISSSDDVEHKINIYGDNNIVNGGNKNDTITILSGTNNTIYGNDGDDCLMSNSANNKVFGNNGNDSITINANNDNYEINGGDGDDIITINANSTTNIQGGNGNDKIYLKGNNNKADGNDGFDTVSAYGNQNTIEVSDSGNTIFTQGNNNIINETNGDNSNNINLQGSDNNLNLNNGNNTINIINSTNANVDVGSGDNNITIVGQNNVIKTKDGNNNISCTGTNNEITTSNGHDGININGDNNIISSGGNNDTISVNFGNGNTIDGGSGEDILSNLGTNTTYSNIEYLKKSSDPFIINIGSNAGDIISIDLGFMLSNILFDIKTQAKAQNSLNHVDSLINQINLKISQLGAYYNRLKDIEELNDTKMINLNSSNSTINDTDIANEMSKLINDQIRTQACINMINSNNNLQKQFLLRILKDI